MPFMRNLIACKLYFLLGTYIHVLRLDDSGIDLRAWSGVRGPFAVELRPNALRPRNRDVVPKSIGTSQRIQVGGENARGAAAGNLRVIEQLLCVSAEAATRARLWRLSFWVRWICCHLAIIAFAYTRPRRMDDIRAKTNGIC